MKLQNHTSIFSALKAIQHAWVLISAIFLLTPQMSLASDSTGWIPKKSVTIIAPSNPGGGWDQTARFIQRAVQAENLIPTSVEVINRGGAGGTIALSELVERYKGNPHKLMICGFGLSSAALMQESEYSLLSATPIARLTGEYQSIAVPANSKYQTLEQLLTDFAKNPAAISWAGGSAGGSDQIFIVQTAMAMGIPTKHVNYVAFTGGGEAAAALMGEQVTAGISGYSEFEPLVQSGRIRLLGISAEDRRLDENLPTLKDAGVDIVFQNWRGLVAPPGLTPKERAFLIETVTKATTSQSWQEALARNNWQDSFLAGDEFAEFIDTDRIKTRAVLAGMGLENSAESASIGPYFFSKIIGFAMLISAAFFTWPAIQARSVTNIRLNNPTKTDNEPTFPRLAITGLAFIIYIFVLHFSGFLIATPIFIFAMSRLIGSKAWVRDLIVAFCLTGAIYVIFEYLLKVSVP